MCNQSMVTVDSEIQVNGILESVCVNVQMFNISMNVILIYRPPDYQNLDVSLDMFQKLNISSNRILDIFETYHMLQIVSQPTRKRICWASSQFEMKN